ncbi:MAG: YggT family protein [Candidatus Marinimicrobia bacterium]|nr:YggT family protein [Candidatus Neomarinimicrobiota bacterium]
MIIASFLGGIVDFILEIYGILIIAHVIVVWFQLPTTNQIVQFILSTTEPILKPTRQILPAVAGLDISPFVVLFVLWLIKLYFGG